jgi:hypothetical protein
MKAFAAGYALTYVTTLTLQLVSWTAIGLTADKFKALILPSQSQSQSQSYFTTGGLPPISSSWCQTPRDSWPEIFFVQLNPCGHSPYVTSVMRGWVCLSWTASAFRQVYVSHIEHVTENSSLCTIYTSSASTDFEKQIMPILLILCYNGSLVTWTVISLTTAKFRPLIFSVSHDFVWLLLVACTILLHIRIHTESWKPCANRGPVCTLENFQ